MANSQIDRDRKFAHTVFLTALITAFIAAYYFLNNPDTDIELGRIFFEPESRFTLSGSIWGNLIRRSAIIGYAIWYTLIVVALIIAIHNIKNSIASPFAAQGRNLAFLVLTSLAGPLLVANILLKNNWGRARPREIMEFGGSLEFTPPLLFSDQCQTNCSFVSGEPSSMFMIFIALAFIYPAHRIMFVLIAIIAGFASGIMRMGQGGHFFSDVVFAGVFMAMVAATIYWLMYLSPLAARFSMK